jgi:LuxR family maltose regulon positive regulatory protein
VGDSSLPYSLYELERLTLAELWIAQDETSRALGLLEALLAQSRALRRTDTMIKGLVLTALAHHQLRHPDQALAALEQALALAQPGGYVRTFVDRGPPMASLLHQALGRSVAVDDVQRLLGAFGPRAVPPTKRPRLVEPLSDRELQVLRLLATHLSNAEIGEQLFVSVNTVRFHARNIYAKLNVHARGDAVQRAKKLGLL